MTALPMTWAGEPVVVSAIREALGRSEAVSSVVLGGSRAQGVATDLSDWDIYLEGDPERMVAEIPGLVASFGPLAAFWEPLSEQAGYMVVMDGPIKVDIFPLGATRVRIGRRSPGPLLGNHPHRSQRTQSWSRHALTSPVYPASQQYR